jgi:hypothetical protein
MCERAVLASPALCALFFSLTHSPPSYLFASHLVLAIMNFKLATIYLKKCAAILISTIALCPKSVSHNSDG